MSNSSYFNIAKKLTKWLFQIPETRIATSSRDVINEIKKLTLDEDETLVSFDVVGLFTNVPVEDSITLAAEMLYNGKFESPLVDMETFIQLCRLSLTYVIMLTTNGIYVQKEGLAMGSPASPLLASGEYSSKNLK